VHENQPLRTKLRVLVADTSHISSQLLSEAVGKDPEIAVVGYSSQPDEIYDLAKNLQPDVLLVNSRLSEEPEAGLSLLGILRTEVPAMKGVVLLNRRGPELVVRAFRCGASGILCAPTLEMLRKCLSAVHMGQIWANSEELSYVLAALAESPKPQPLESSGLHLLSKREREVVGYLVEGLTNRQIAYALAISEHTVKNYVFKIFEKLGVANRVELAFNLLSGGANSHSTSQTRFGAQAHPGHARNDPTSKALSSPGQAPHSREARTG
jgi:DNA-binding NarL/FixJ family response regulator